MKTPKIFSLYKLIDWLVSINKNSNLKKLPLNTDSLNKMLGYLDLLKMTVILV